MCRGRLTLVPTTLEAFILLRFKFYNFRKNATCFNSFCYQIATIFCSLTCKFCTRVRACERPQWRIVLLATLDWFTVIKNKNKYCVVFLNCIKRRKKNEQKIQLKSAELSWASWAGSAQLSSVKFWATPAQLGSAQQKFRTTPAQLSSAQQNFDGCLAQLSSAQLFFSKFATLHLRSPLLFLSLFSISPRYASAQQLRREAKLRVKQTKNLRRTDRRCF